MMIGENRKFAGVPDNVLVPETKKASPEAKASEHERRLRNAGGNFALRCSPEVYATIRIEARGNPFIKEYKPELNKLFLSGWESHFTTTLAHLAGDVSGAEEFRHDLGNLKSEVEQFVQMTGEAAKRRVEREQDRQATFHKKLQNFEEMLKEQWRTEVLVEQLESKLPRKYTEPEETRLIHAKDFVQHELERNDGDARKRQTSLEQKMMEYEKERVALQSNLDSLSEDISELEDKMNPDKLTQDEFSEFGESLGFGRAKASAIHVKLYDLLESKLKVEPELKKVHHEKDVFSLVLESRELFQKLFKNWKDRRERALERLQRVVTDFEELEAASEAIDNKWRELTQDFEPLCAPLIVKKQILFV